jgi:hypothetical protein
MARALDRAVLDEAALERLLGVRADVVDRVKGTAGVDEQDRRAIDLDQLRGAVLDLAGCCDVDLGHLGQLSLDGGLELVPQLLQPHVFEHFLQEAEHDQPLGLGLGNPTRLQVEEVLVIDPSDRARV